MRRIMICLIGVLLLIPLANAHAVDKGPVSKSTDDYIIEFSTNPKFPVTGKETHFDFIVKDKENNFMNNADIKIKLHREETAITLNLNEEEKGHYNIEHLFREAGKYEVHLVINNKEVETEFEIEVDSFGLSGWLSVGVIIIFLLILIGLMYKDCRKS